MEIVVSGRHTEVPERFRRLAEEKLLKVGQLAPKAHRTDVELSHERNPRQSQNCEKVEITVRGKGPVIRAEASAEDPAAALDLAFGKLARAAAAHRRPAQGAPRQADARVRAGRPGDAGAPAPTAQRWGPLLDGALDSGFDGGHDAGPDGALDGASPVVIRDEDHDAVPMSLEQALYEMELVGHDFFLFVDAETDAPSVVYRRRGWSYGVIRLKVS